MFVLDYTLDFETSSEFNLVFTPWRSSVQCVVEFGRNSKKQTMPPLCYWFWLHYWNDACRMIRALLSRERARSHTWQINQIKNKRQKADPKETGTGWIHLHTYSIRERMAHTTLFITYAVAAVYSFSALDLCHTETEEEAAACALESMCVVKRLYSQHMFCEPTIPF